MMEDNDRKIEKDNYLYDPLIRKVIIDSFDQSPLHKS